MRDIFGSHPGAFIQHRFVPKDKRQAGQELCKRLFLSAVPHFANVHLWRFVFCFFLTFPVNMMSSPVFILEINSLNGSPSPVTLFSVCRRTKSRLLSRLKNCSVGRDHVSLVSARGLLADQSY